MPKLIVKTTFLFDNDKDKNFVFLNPLTHQLFPSNQVKIINRHGEHVFDKGFYQYVPYGHIALTRKQQKKHSLKKRHSYQVLPYIPNLSPVSITTIFDNEYKYREQLGGLDDVFETIFSDVLLSRFYPRAFVDLTGLTKPGDFILYGPSDAEKTSIAKVLAHILNVTPKIVSGPELFNWLLGESEAKVRALFQAAHLDQETYGSQSPLHLIIFDEIDSICKSRSLDNPATCNSVHNSITTQILTEIDGMRYLNNILIIGTPNVLKAIDTVLVRPGQLDTLIEVPLPNAKGRSDISNIYTKTLLKNSLMSEDVDVESIIYETQGMTGAHIEQLVRHAVHSAMKRDLQSRGTLDISDEDAENFCIKNMDFVVTMAQLQKQVENHTAF